MTDKVNARVSVVRAVRLDRPSALEGSIFYYPVAYDRVSIQTVSPIQDRKIRQADLVGVSVDDGGHSEIACIDRVLADLEFEIATTRKFGVSMALSK